ncbi:hypothetical protein [Thermomonas beijingensis]|uniref:hypothetical protein n=1 Tax=Thermomonas beijingensis TaxID=2872701 RepID=UPI001CBF135D|nr:hypothetical protein [Thermomonas beijingensis]
MYIFDVPVDSVVTEVPVPMPSASGVLLKLPEPVIFLISWLFIFFQAIDPELSRINRIFGATRTPVSNG